jgi:hypothetical protein
MSDDVPELVELARLQEAYREALEDVASMQLNEVARVAKMLEIEARFLGAFEACREALAKQQRPRHKTN